MKTITEFLLSNKTKFKEYQLSEDISFDDTIKLFSNMDYEIKECETSFEFFDENIKEHVLLILKSPVGNNIRFILNLNVYKISFSSNQKYITNIFVIERKNGAHYNAPNSTHTVKNVIDEINKQL